MAKMRGFTLLELLVATALSSIVAAAAFLALSSIQRSASRQARIADTMSQGRLAADLIARDVRSAGDSHEFLPSHCIAGMESPGTTFNCAAILDPHPWRVTLTRNSWHPGADSFPLTMDDRAPQAAFNLEGENVVAYEFVPNGGARDFGDGHRGYVGRIVQIVNPFGFEGEAPRVTVLAENVLVDNRMRVNPANPAQNDPRYDYSVFLYQLLRVPPEEYNGDPSLVERATRQGSHILPPVRFYNPEGPFTSYLTATPAPPWLPPHGGPNIVGLHPGPTAEVTLFKSSGSFDSDMRYVLDYNRIRGVRIAFKILDAEDPDYQDGVDVDPESPGTARVFTFESLAELKSFSAFVM